uniref:Uncharacterized protein n=1 Tax=Anguilla anguilla TaxID=7936 RepID=A0A0E9SZC2_ANGAN
MLHECPTSEVAPLGYMAHVLLLRFNKPHVMYYT